MTSSSRKLITVGLSCMVLAAVFATLNCSKEEEEAIPHYDGWLTYSYKHFVFHYPEDSFWGKKIESFSNAYERYLQDDCEFLGIDVPVDTIHFYIHNNSREGEELTGRKLPFHTKRQIHWDRIPPFGLELARFLIDWMQIRRTDYDFLYDGLATLRDYSGDNYHHKTIARVELGQYIPLDSLINNESYARQHERHRVEEAASLVAYITYNFGINRFKMLWQSTASFERSVKELFNMDLAAFEDNWLAFAQLHFEGLRETQKITDTLTIEPKKK